MITKIATLGSHTALNILRGAKDEGFETLLIASKKRSFYSRFNVADKIMYVDNMGEFLAQKQNTFGKDSVVVPHGSFISYLSIDFIEKEFNVPLFGNKFMFRWESDRNLENEWLKGAKIHTPKVFDDPSEIDRLAIVKHFGAKGGRGYFLARDYNDFKKKSSGITGEYQIQEYVIGVPMYFHFFYSPLDREVELLSIDRRYETNVDSMMRIPADDQKELGIAPSYVVVGNFPLVIRESMLEDVFDMGEKVVKMSQKIDDKGLIGPFCLETICTPDLEIVAFEISARIVAGTNPFIPSSPYTYLKYGKDISCGRRIAMEIKKAIESDSLEEVTT
ncbi:MAG: formate--phosphoribosylaminoimidazolecarboxamide ligase [Candidatus Methanofastidiosia archaeon]